MVMLRIVYSNRAAGHPNQFQAEMDGGLQRSIFDITADGSDAEFENERDGRLQMLADFVSQGYRVWKIQKRKGTP